MAHFRPVAGYPSKRAAFIGLFQQGLGVEDIVAKTGAEKHHVKAVLRAVELIEPARPRHCGRQSMPVRVRAGTITVLETHAAQRGLTANQLGARLLDMIARDDLFSAVLDDAEAITAGGAA